MAGVAIEGLAHGEQEGRGERIVLARQGAHHGRAPAIISPVDGGAARNQQAGDLGVSQIDGLHERRDARGCGSR